MKILVINGPNLNLIGVREKNVYGTVSYEDICNFILEEGKKMQVEIEIKQSNSEGGIIDFLHAARGVFDGIIINPGAYTHYSYAIHDAIKAISVPTVEVHLSNIHAREEFRSKSVTAPACKGQVSGFGHYGYVMAMNYLIFEGNNKCS